MVSDWWQKWFGYKFLAQDNVAKFLFKKLKQNKLFLFWSPVLTIYIAGYLSSRNKSLHQVNVMQVFLFLLKRKSEPNVLFFSESKVWTKPMLFRILPFPFQKGNSEQSYSYSEFSFSFLKGDSQRNNFIQNSSLSFLKKRLWTKWFLHKSELCLFFSKRKFWINKMFV